MQDMDQIPQISDSGRVKSKWNPPQNLMLLCPVDHQAKDRQLKLGTRLVLKFVNGLLCELQILVNFRGRLLEHHSASDSSQTTNRHLESTQGKILCLGSCWVVQIPGVPFCLGFHFWANTGIC